MKAASSATASRTKEKKAISNAGKKRVYNRKKQQQQSNNQALLTTEGKGRTKPQVKKVMLAQSMPQNEIELFGSNVVDNNAEIGKINVSSASSSPTSSIASSQQHSADYEAEDESDDNVISNPEKSQNLMQVQKFLNCIAKEQRNVKKHRALSSSNSTDVPPETVASTEVSAIIPAPIPNFQSIASVALVSSPLDANKFPQTAISTTAIAPIENANTGPTAKSTVSELRTWRQNKGTTASNSGIKKIPPSLTCATNIAPTKPSTTTTPTKLRKFNISPKFLHKSRNKLKSFTLLNNKSAQSAATMTTTLTANTSKSEELINVVDAAKSKMFSIDSLLKKQQ